MGALDDVMKEALSKGAFPGAVIRVSEKGGPVYENAFGVCDVDSNEPVTVRTVYDLASLTKPLSTAPAVMILIQEGKLSLDATLDDLLPGESWKDKGAVSVAQLLTHTSGLPDYQPYYKELVALAPDRRNGELKKRLVAEPLLDPPGTVVRYSDIGYMILAWVIEAIAKEPLSVFVEKKVYAPLCIDDLFYIKTNGHEYRDRSIAPTERCPWRKRLLRGEVHDDNCWVMGGEGAHAGLFGAASGVDSMISSLIDDAHAKHRVFDPELSGVFLSEWRNTRRTPGFDMPSKEGSSSGRYFPVSAVGHLGYTGTSFWVDLGNQRVVILLTNRVHPTRENIKIRQFRPLIHDAVMEDLFMNR